MKRLFTVFYLSMIAIMFLQSQSPSWVMNTATKQTRLLDTLMVQVSGGTFQMGSDSISTAEQPVHPVTLSSYYMDITEVTFDKWTAVRDWGLTHGYTDLPTGANGYNTTDPNQPVVNVNWYDAIKWCNARTEMDSLAPVYYTDSTQSEIYKTGDISLTNKSVNRSSDGYRLPTEAEWEFAAMGGNLSYGYKYSGSNIIDSVGWYDDKSNSMTHPVKSLAPNEIGIYDMSGNAAEWCWDRWGYFTSASQINPLGPITGPQRDIRGGHWGTFATDAAVKHRSYGVIAQRIANIGFRCARGAVGTSVGENGNSTPRSFHLEQNYPNPFNPVTRIDYDVPKQGMVTLKVFDVLGREVTTLVNNIEQAGHKSVTLDASQLSSGVYFYRLVVSSSNPLQAGNFITTKKMILAR